MRFKRNKSKKSLINQANLSIKNIKSQLNHTSDLKDREIHSNNQIYIILYINSLVDQEKLESKIIKPLIKMENNNILNELYSQEISTAKSNKIAINGLLDGYCLLIKKGRNSEGFLLKTNASTDREVSEPIVEKTILGQK